MCFQITKRTMKQFAEQCEHLSHDEIYELFENTISDELRGQIYSLCKEETPEPARAALNMLGEIYNIESLRNY